MGLHTDTHRSPKCSLLAATFPGQVYFPGDASFTANQSSYWSAQQAELAPSCRFYPHNARDIQEALADTFIPYNVSIAVASGGHSSVVGASNIDQCITVDLAKMSKINTMDWGKTLDIGPGARWKDVYAFLDPHNLTLPGSRVADVGVGGYVLGGGLNWLANDRGWACDTVLALEVVTSNAEILRVSPSAHEDLFWALKGSLGAFGIVTEIHVATDRGSNVFGGALTYEEDHLPALSTALNNLALDASSDLATQGYLSFGWIEAEKHFSYSAYLVNRDGHDSSKNLMAFDTIPHSASTLRNMTIGESANEIGKSNPPGLRRAKFTLTTKCSKAVILALHELTKTSIKNISFDRDSVLGVTYQPLTIPHLRAQSNVFSIAPITQPLLLVSVELWWSDSTKDAHLEGRMKSLRLSMEAQLKDMKALHPFIYPNYAARDQDPFASLPPSTKHMLQAIKKRYDPDDLWRRLVPGIWHI